VILGLEHQVPEAALAARDDPLGVRVVGHRALVPQLPGKELLKPRLLDRRREV